MTAHDASRPGWLIGTMLASLVVLMLDSLAFVVASPDPRGVGGLPPGIVLAVVKCLALARIFQRVRAANVYSMQWSSMSILLFIAEGAVRATSDPQPTAALGAAEAIVAAVYFMAVLSFLRPFKQRARHGRSAGGDADAGADRSAEVRTGGSTDAGTDRSAGGSAARDADRTVP